MTTAMWVRNMVVASLLCATQQKIGGLFDYGHTCSHYTILTAIRGQEIQRLGQDVQNREAMLVAMQAVSAYVRHPRTASDL